MKDTFIAIILGLMFGAGLAGVINSNEDRRSAMLESPNDCNTGVPQ